MEEVKYERKKRKRKKTILANAKKYGKRANYGRGFSLPEDIYHYFVNILEVYKNGFPNEEEKLLFVNNVFEQIKGDEINYSSNQIGCRIFETLLPFASFEIHDRFITGFNHNLRLYCTDQFASYVLQTLLKISCQTTDGEHQAKYKEFSIKLSKFLLNNMEDFIMDTNANHIMRIAIQHLAESENNDDFKTIVKEYGDRLIVWPQLNQLPYTELTSGFLQILLQSLHKIDLKLLRKIQKKLLDQSFAIADQVDNDDDDESKLFNVFKSKAAIMLLETSMSVASFKSFTQIYTKCFSGKLALLARRKETNFAVQKLINYCTEKTQFDAIFDEICGHFEEILHSGYTGVILSIAQACKRLGTKQGNFLQNLMNSLHCSDPIERQNSFVPAILYLVPYEYLEKQNENFVNLHGSVVLQTMFGFNKPIKIINSILAQKSDYLKHLFCDSKGSHVIDAYMNSEYVGEKSREKLLRKMKGTYQELAVSKFGSRSIETIWNVSNQKQRLEIMDELSYKDSLWSSTPIGKIIAYKFNVKLYKSNKDEWKQSNGKNDKTKNMFSHIIQDT